MSIRSVTAVVILVGLMSLVASVQLPVRGQTRGTPPPLVITATAGNPVAYKAPRTPWGDPDLQGVWSSDDMEGVPMGRPATATALYLDDAPFAARQASVARGATQRDTNADSTFRFDYARRAFRQTSLIVDPPDGRLPSVRAVVETTNLTDRTAVGVNGNGVRHSAQMVITERFRRIADNMVQYQATFDDPLTYERPFTVSFPLTPLDGGMLLPYECHPGNTAISMSLAAERAEDRAVAADAAKGIIRERRGVQDGAGVGAAPAGGGRGGRGRGAGAAPAPLPAGAATGERDQER